MSIWNKISQISTSTIKPTDHILREIDRGILEKQDKIPRRKYLGASSLGDECSRKIQYRYMGIKPDVDKKFDAKTLRIFAMGHVIEDLMAMYIRDCGFLLKTEKNNEQFGFETGGGEIRGHIDGVIVGGPLNMKYPMLWECKSANDKKFNEFVKNGVANTNPVYAAQVALYQAYMDLTENPCMFTVMNKNNSEIYIELIDFNQNLAQTTSDKAVNILEATKANEILPRIAQNDDFYLCKMCDFYQTCWNKNTA